MAYIGNTAPSRFVSNRAASVYSGDGSTVAFTLEQVVTQDEDVLVSVDGVIQEPSVAYAVSSGTTLTFTAAPSSNAGNNIFVYYLASQAGTVGHPSSQALSATNGTFTGDVGIGTSPATILHIKESAPIFTQETTGNVTTSGVAYQQVKDVSGSSVFTQGFAGLANCYQFGTSIANGFMRFLTGSAVETMRIDATGAVTMPKQPSFLARPASQQNNITNDSQHNQVAFGTEVFDRNADFTSNTFTAPIEGLYQFNAHIYVQAVDSAATALYIVIKTSNREYLNVIDPDFGQDAAYWTFTMSVLADMDANDTTDIKIVQVSGTAQTDINVGSSFSGYLVA